MKAKLIFLKIAFYRSLRKSLQVSTKKMCSGQIFVFVLRVTLIFLHGTKTILFHKYFSTYTILVTE